MSFPLRQKLIRLSIWALAASAMVLVVTAAHAGPTAEQKCHAGKNNAAGKYYACLHKASATYAKTLDFAKLVAALGTCNTKFDAAWEKQDTKAADAGTTCLDAGVSELNFRNFIAANWGTVDAALGGAALQSCGNGTVEAPEACDGSALGGATCVTQGFAGGTLRCASGCALDPSGCYATRFVDNGDGTVTDHQTGLQWEKKNGPSDGNPSADPHDVDNAYYWCETNFVYDGPCVNGPIPDGNAFTSFLATLNGGTTAVGDCFSTDGTTLTGGFAGHCDWRVPTIAELKTLVDLTQGACGGGTGACIDPAIGPTGPYNLYWSSTTAPDDSFRPQAWRLNFGNGTVEMMHKGIYSHVRAVRGAP